MAAIPPLHPSNLRQKSRADIRQSGVSTMSGRCRLSSPDNDPSSETFDWSDPVDFLAKKGVGAPVLGPRHIPVSLAPFIFDAASRMGVDPSSIALAALVACAAVINDDWAVQPKQHDYTWTENARLWGAIVGDPSILKSPVIALCTRPVEQLEEQARKCHAEEMQVWRTAVDLAKESKSPDPLPPRQPKLKRYLVEGTTPEALLEVLRDDAEAKMCAPQHKLLSRHDELSEFVGSLDRYKAGGKGGSERGAYLRLYNGGRYSVDRIGRGSFAVPNWSACFIGGCQPGPIRRIANDMADDGLLQRFIFAVPDGQIQGLDQQPDQGAIDGYHALFPALAVLAPPRNAVTGLPQPVVLAAGAHALRIGIDALAAAMTGTPDASARLVASFGKWPGLFARLCLTFHLIEIADARAKGQSAPPFPVIQTKTAERVSSYMKEIVLPHMMRAEAIMFNTEQTGHAQWLAGFILAHELRTITTRDIARSYRPFKKPEAARDLAAVMQNLEALGWIERVEPMNPVRAVTSWTVNPKVHILFAARAEQEKVRRRLAKEQIAAGHYVSAKGVP